MQYEGGSGLIRGGRGGRFVLRQGGELGEKEKRTKLGGKEMEEKGKGKDFLDFLGEIFRCWPTLLVYTVGPY